MNDTLKNIKTVLKLKGYNFEEIEANRCISTYLTVVLGYKMQCSKIIALNKIFYSFTKDSKPDIIVSNKLEDDLMTINSKNTEWYIDEKQYTTKDILKKIHSNEL